MEKIFWFIKQSIILDVKFLKISPWRIFKKCHFLALKYFLIFKHFFKKFELGKDFCWWERKKLYYDSKFGIAGYQSILTRHQKLIKIAEIRNCHNIIDIGANVGFFSKLCRDLFPKSKIFAFEPIPTTFQCLENNFRDDRRTKVFNLALGDLNGKGKMNFDKQNSAVSQITSNGKIEVEIKTLDSIVKEEKIKNISLLKVDTETFEAHVLRGAPNTLSKTNYLLIEITIKDNENYTISSLLKLLSSEEYDFQLVSFRNYADKSEGIMPIMDALFFNKKLTKASKNK